jgi:hypothetical protein
MFRNHALSIRSIGRLAHENNASGSIVNCCSELRDESRRDFKQSIDWKCTLIWRWLALESNDLPALNSSIILARAMRLALLVFGAGVLPAFWGWCLSARHSPNGFQRRGGGSELLRKGMVIGPQSNLIADSHDPRYVIHSR